MHELCEVPQIPGCLEIFGGSPLHCRMKQSSLLGYMHIVSTTYGFYQLHCSGLIKHRLWTHSSKAPHALFAEGAQHSYPQRLSTSSPGAVMTPIRAMMSAVHQPTDIQPKKG